MMDEMMKSRVYSKDTEERVFLAGNTYSLSFEAALILSDDVDEKVRRNLAHFTEFPEILTKLSRDKFCLGAVANNTNTPEEILDALSTSELPIVRYYVAGNINTRYLTIKTLLRDPDDSVRVAALTNHNNSIKTLTGFYNHPNDCMRIAVVKHPNVSVTLMATIAENESSEKVLSAIIENPKITDTVVDKLLNNPHPSIIPHLNKISFNVLTKLSETDIASVFQFVLNHPKLTPGLKKQMMG